MKAAETIHQFYARTQAEAVNTPLNNTGSGHFNVFTRENCKGTPYGRRDFYKISLVIGKGRLQYADRWLDMDAPALLISNPRVPYSWEPMGEQKGWYCLFTEQMLLVLVGYMLHCCFTGIELLFLHSCCLFLRKNIQRKCPYR